jgi:hypothetical protein
MLRFGITGHRSLPDPSGWAYVQSTLADQLARASGPIAGLSSLAAGADQVFGDAILARGGALDVVLPFATYRKTLPEGPWRDAYDRLLGQAASVRVLDGDASEELAYLRAGEIIARECDILLAVWDEEPARGLGGTANIVDYALSLPRRVVVVNPIRRRIRDCHAQPRG